MKNHRPLIIHSKVFGSNDRLKLVLIDNKRYIQRRDLYKYFFELHWKISDFNTNFGLGHRVVRGSLYKWFTPEEIEQSHREKISLKQMGENNSNSVNWGVPRKHIEIEDLKKVIESSQNRNQALHKLGMAKPTFQNLVRYYNLKFPETPDSLINNRVHSLTRTEVRQLITLLKSSGLLIDFLSDDPKKVADTILETQLYLFDFHLIIRKLKRLFRKIISKYDIKFPSNFSEHVFLRAFQKLHIEVIPQYYFPDLRIHVDYLIPKHNIVVELDGQFHDLKRDKERDSTLESKGYTIVRIILDKRLMSRRQPIKTAIKCLRESLLPVLER